MFDIIGLHQLTAPLIHSRTGETVPGELCCTKYDTNSNVASTAASIVLGFLCFVDHHATESCKAIIIVVSDHLQASCKPCQQGSSDLHQTLSAFYETETLQDINLMIKTSCQRYYGVFRRHMSHHWKFLVC